MWQKACFRAVQCPACSTHCLHRDCHLQARLSAESVRIRKNNWINLDQSGAVESSFCRKLWILHLKSRLVNFEHIQSTEETVE